MTDCAAGRLRGVGLLEGGLVTSNNPVWRQDRRLLNPCFTHQAIAHMHAVFQRHARKLVQHIHGRCSISTAPNGHGGEATGVVLDLGELCTAMALDVVCDSYFGCSSIEGGDDVMPAIRDALQEIGRRLTDPVRALRYLPGRWWKARRATRTLLRVRGRKAGS